MSRSRGAIAPGFNFKASVASGWVALIVMIAANAAIFAAPPATRPASKPTTRPVTRPAGVRIEELQKLRETALGPDWPAARAAIDQLKNLGLPARQTLSGTLRDILIRDRTDIQNTIAKPTDAARLKLMETQLGDLRQAARANVGKLDHDQTLQIAHTNYDKLSVSMEELYGIYRGRATVVQALDRRGELLTLWHTLMPLDNTFFAAGEDRLRASAQKWLGPAADNAAPATPSDAQSLASIAGTPFGLYCVSRQIESFNRGLEPLMNAEEVACLHLINGYREMLGVVPFEIDPRAVQSARRHSKEMIDLKYFAHESPTAGLKMPWDRMAAAGVKAKGFSENIAKGMMSGERAFWVWFDSPPHHKGMSSAGVTCLGVGQWDDAWTLNMATTPPSFIASKPAAVAADADLAPQDPRAPQPHQRPKGITRDRLSTWPPQR